MSWNYRIIECQGVLALHEVYYAWDNKTITSWSTDPILDGYTSLEELWSDLELMTNDAVSNRPILKLSELEQLSSEKGEHTDG